MKFDPETNLENMIAPKIYIKEVDRNHPRSPYVHLLPIVRATKYWNAKMTTPSAWFYGEGKVRG